MQAVTRYALDISYKGTAYAGWQRQLNAVAVQETLEAALQTLLIHPVATTGAGRTDTGVHAWQQIVHFDTEGELPLQFRHKLNAILPPDIAINRVYRCLKADFHARYDAIGRSYVYRIVTGKSPFELESALWVRRNLDWVRMSEAAAMLPHYEDFAAFARLHGNNKTTICRVSDACWEMKESQGLVMFHIRADRFLRGMVRGIVGTLLKVGSGDISPEAFGAIIRAGQRANAGPNADPKGLFLSAIHYPEGLLQPIEDE